jgi:putative ABC transport system permease protein
MRFVLRMAARETRASWHRLLFFFVCIAVGVAAIVALRSIIQSVRDVFGQEAKSLIAADVLISTNRDWTQPVRETIARRLAEFGASETTETVETPTMVRPADASKPLARMAELRAVQGAFPLYGTLELEGGATYSHSMLEHHGALVRRELLASFGLAVGDQIAIGQATFTVRGVIANEPGRSVVALSLGPRVMIDYDDLASTELLAYGSQARRVIQVRVPEGRIEPLASTLRAELRDQFVGVRSYRARDDEMGRDFDRAENYLSLVGLIIVILGGIAVSSVTRVFILQKIRSIAVLKCVGATSGRIVAVYLVQVLLLGLAGSLLGVALARGIIAAIPLALGGSTSILADAHYGVTWSAGLQGMAIGMLVSLLFSIVPLLEVRLVKPSLLLRDDDVRRPRDWTRVGTIALVTAALVAVTAWQVASLKIGLIVCAGFAGLAIVLVAVGRALVWAVAPLARARSFPLRHAMLRLSRPGNQTRVILLAVGLGAFFIVGVRSLQSSLLDQFSVEMSENAPDMFLMDIQQEQAGGVGAFLSDPLNGTSEWQLIPVLRARISGVRGRQTTPRAFEDVRARGSLRHEYTVTYRDRLERNEQIIAGSFWRGPSPEAEVSIEQSVRERFGIDVGDVITFDILGQAIDAKVSSVREVDWKDSRSGGFMFVFRPGVLDKAPHWFVAPLKGPADADARARLQHDLVERFPNISVIDFRDILVTIRDVMSKVTLAVTVVGALVLLSGGLILVGAVAMTKFQRVYEAAVFKTLGATTAAVAWMLLVEYGVLGLLAGLVGSLGAIALTWGVSRFALEIPWRVFAGEHVGGVVLTAVLVAAIGVLSSLDVLKNKPLATLRTE